MSESAVPTERDPGSRDGSGPRTVAADTADGPSPGGAAAVGAADADHPKVAAWDA